MTAADLRAREQPVVLDRPRHASPADGPRARRLARPGLERWLAAAGWLVVALGVALRVRQWFAGRSFWLDENALWLAMQGQGFGELVRPLPLVQAAPIGWLWAEHAVMVTFGDGERSARLMPLLFGCGAVVLAAVLARRVLGPVAALAATVLVAFSPLLVYYSNEFKQYSADVFWSLLLVLLGVVLAEREVLRPRWAAGLGATAATCVWFSHAAALTAAGVLGALGLLALLDRQWRRLLLLVAAGVSLAVSLAVDYAVALSKAVDNTDLQTYWRLGFPPRPLRPGSFAGWVADSVPRLLDRPLALSHQGLVLALLVAGLAVLGARRSRVLLVLLMPLAVLLAAAVLRAYPAADRLVLFAVPTVLLVLAAPLDLLRRHRSRAATALAAIVAVAVAAGLTVLAAPSLRQAGVYAVHPMEKEETKTVLGHIARHIQPGDLVLFDSDHYAVQVYGPRVGLSKSVVRLVGPAVPSCQPDAVNAALRQQYRRVWLAWGHPFSYIPASARDGYRANLATIGRRVDSVRATGSGADLYDLTLPAEDPDRTDPLLRARSTRCLTLRDY